MIKNLAQQKAQKIAWAGKTAVFIGDSITAGSSSSDNAHRWTTLFCVAKSCTESNLGIGGQVLQSGTVCGRTVFDQTTIPTYSSSTHAGLFIALGVNDIGVNNGTMTPSGFQTRLQTVIDYATGTKGWPSGRIILITPTYLTSSGYLNYVGTCSVVSAADVTRHTDYVNTLAMVAYSKGCRSVNPYAEMKNSALPSSMISGVDGIHPNDTGHAFIANVIIGAL